MISDWEFKSGEYATMGGLIAYIHNTSLTKFKQEQLQYIIIQYGKFKHLEYGFKRKKN